MVKALFGKYHHPRFTKSPTAELMIAAPKTTSGIKPHSDINNICP